MRGRLAEDNTSSFPNYTARTASYILVTAPKLAANAPGGESAFVFILCRVSLDRMAAYKATTTDSVSMIRARETGVGDGRRAINNIGLHQTGASELPQGKQRGKQKDIL